MKTLLKDYIFFKETDEENVFTTYLSPELGESEDGINTILMKLKRVPLPLETLTVSSSLNKDQIYEVIVQHGIDTVGITKSILKEEMEQGLEKKILEKIIECAEQNVDQPSKLDSFLKIFFGFEKKISWKTPDDLVKKLLYRFNRMNSESRIPGKNFIIVSPMVASYLQDSPYFIYDSMDQNQVTNSLGFIYSIGHLAAGNIKVLVDPKFSFSNHKIYLGVKPDDSQCAIFAAEKSKEEFLQKEIINLSFLPEIHIRLYKKFGVTSVPSKFYSSFTITKEGETHNLFTHLLGTIKPFFKKLINPSFR